MPAPVPARSPFSRRAALIAAALIVLAALVAYADSFTGPFVFDDKDAITENASIRQFSTAWSPPPDTTASGRPVLNFSLAVSYALSRNAVWGYHALNVLFHILAGLTLFGITRRTLLGWSALRSPTKPGEGGLRNALHPTLVAFVTALLWTVHPLQTESVTYVIQRAESLMGLFYLLTLYCFIRFAERGSAFAKAPADKEAGRRRWALLSILACFFGMGTKEAMVSAPVIVLLYDRTFLAGSFGEAWRRRRSFYLGLASSWILLFWLVASAGGNRGGTIGFGVGVAWWAYGLTQFRAIATYLKLSLWPAPLIFDHGTVWVTGALEVVPYAVVVGALAMATGWFLFRPPDKPGNSVPRPIFGGQVGGRALGFAGAFFFAVLAPTSLVPGTTQMIVEHRMYLSLAAVIAVVVAGVNSLAGRRGLAVLGVLALPLAVLTSQRNRDYRTELALWSDTVAKQPGNARAETSLGSALLEAGDAPGAINQIQAALRLEPGSYMAQTDWGNALQKTGQVDAALVHYQESLRLNPNYAPAHIDFGSLLYQLGRIPEAMAQYEAAVRIRPNDAEAQLNLGMCLARIGQMPEALLHYEAAVRLKPDLAEGRFNLGNALRSLGGVPEAIAQYEEALRLTHPYPEASMNLGNLLLQQGRTTEAISQFEDTLQARPGYAEAHNSLGVALGRSGRWAEAVGEYQKALQLNPDYAQAHSNLAQALQQLGRTDHASTP